MPHLHSLPFEILYNIMYQLDINQLSITRTVSRRMRSVCDRPELWKNVQLKPQENSFWSLRQLKSIITPHVRLIQKLDIWNARDDNVHYILLNCPHLQELTVYGWITLSDHAFILPQHICLRRLRLIGETKNNFTSLDSITFSKFIQRCPQLEELSIVSCHIHLHAESLIETLHHHHPLKYLNIATKQSWSIEHILRLFQLCSNLSILGLVPDFIPGSNSSTVNENWSILQKNYQFIQEHEMIEFSNIILFRQ